MDHVETSVFHINCQYCLQYILDYKIIWLGWVQVPYNMT